jgi:hypothetical protein
MSHYYGTLSGQAKTTATRRGSKKSGVYTQAASWAGSIRVELVHDPRTDKDTVSVTLQPWHGAGKHAVLVSSTIQDLNDAAERGTLQPACTDPQEEGDNPA